MLNSDTNLIGTMQEFKDSMYGYISDASKDAQGFRTRFDYTAMTAEELMTEAAYWERRVVEAIEEEAIINAENEAELEADIAKFIEMGAGDRMNAMRWLIGADNGDAVGGLEGFFWGFNISWEANRKYCEEFAELADFAIELQYNWSKS